MQGLKDVPQKKLADVKKTLSRELERRQVVCLAIIKFDLSVHSVVCLSICLSVCLPSTLSVSSLSLVSYYLTVEERKI